jgi:hypothetical protein
MNRFISGLAVALALSAWSVIALADGVQPATTSTTSSATPPTSTILASTQPAASDAAVQRMVCLNMALKCFAIRPNTSDEAAKLRAASLDLKAPDIRILVPESELRQPLPEPAEIEQVQVQVEGSRPEVYVPGGLASLPWALMHPTQAWRIFLPVPAGQAK